MAEDLETVRRAYVVQRLLGVPPDAALWAAWKETHTVRATINSPIP
jgi:hypothetical protein